MVRLISQGQLNRYASLKKSVKANNPKILIPIAIVLAAVVYAGNFLTGGAPYSANPADLKAQFNNDKGKVRLVMLLAPT